MRLFIACVAINESGLPFGGKDSPFQWERERSDDNDARALFLATRLRNASNFSGSSRSFDLTPACFRTRQPTKSRILRPQQVEGRARNDRRGVDLMSDALPFGRLWYGEPNAISNAIGYAKHRSRSHEAGIRVYDDAGPFLGSF